MSNKSQLKNEKIKRQNNQIIEIESLRQRLDVETPPCGYYPKITDENNETVPINLRPKSLFKELPLSNRTLRGLNDDKKFKMTPIQRASLPHSLYNRDIIGSSKTGSGKTFSFVIPVLEKLYLNKWSSIDGVGALIILPTRELAIQVFEVFRVIGKYHDFSLGLVIGGNNLEKEKSTLYHINILIGTPGRIIQHITETPYFTLDNLQILVVDEADRILDEGFEKELNEIITYLPTNRQTLLFSATITKTIKSLAKMNLKCPEKISINNIENLMSLSETIETNDKLSRININIKDDKEKNNKSDSENLITPKNLHQFYTKVNPEDKLNVLYSFLNTHKNMKILIFLSSCKEVRFFYETFKRLKLGFTFLELHGGQKQNKRTAIFYTFLEKSNSVLFATDIAARGMDFPCINWVIQVDAPEDLSTYIHRVGRTARYKSQGNSLLFLSQSETEYLNYFNSKSIPIKSISINKDKIVNLQPIIRSILSENPDINYLAQRAIISYVKSIAYQSNKKIFNHKSIDIEKLALSFGLMMTPKIVDKSKTREMDEDEESDEEGEKKLTKLEKYKAKIKKKKEESRRQKEEEEKGFLKIKRKLSVEDNENEKDVKEKKAEKSMLITSQDKENIKKRYKEIESELRMNEYTSKMENKERVKSQHKQQRIAQKARDYERHGHGKNTIKEGEYEDDEDSGEDEEDKEYKKERKVDEEEETSKDEEESLITNQKKKSNLKELQNKEDIAKKLISANNEKSNRRLLI